MLKVRENVWGREFSLPVQYQVLPGEELAPEQVEASTDIQNHWDVVNASLPKVKAYVESEYGYELEGRKVGDIFECITPTTLLITCDHDPIAALVCDANFDDELQIAAAFRDSRFLKVCDLDELL